MDSKSIYKSNVQDIYNAVEAGEVREAAYLITQAASEEWFIKDRDTILNRCLNTPATAYAFNEDGYGHVCRPGHFGSENGYDYEKYEYMVKVLLMYAKGITLSEKSITGTFNPKPCNDLTFLRFMKDISDLDFTDIKIKLKNNPDPVPVTREMLIARKFPGAEKAIVSAGNSLLVQQRVAWQGKVVKKESLAPDAIVALPKYHRV